MAKYHSGTNRRYCRGDGAIDPARDTKQEHKRLVDYSRDVAWEASYKNQLLAELIEAYHDARKGKRWTFDEHEFEANAMENLIKLRDSIYSKTYTPSRGTVHIIFHPVIREIFAAPFRDRIVHHWIYNSVAGWWDRHFIDRSFSCRKGKGTLVGIKTLARDIQSVSDNYKKDPIVIKLDIQGYFMSLSRKLLYERAVWGLDRQFKGNRGKKYELLKYCWGQVIFDDPCNGVRRIGWPKDWKNLPKNKSLFFQKPGFGIMIGNLTSQLLSNIILDQLDRFVTQSLGYKHYGRYVDDFYIVVDEEHKAQALTDIAVIERFLLGLGLKLHPNKRYIQPASKGIDFLGAKVGLGWIYPGKRIVKNAKKAFREVTTGRRSPESVQSYIGLMQHYKSQKVLKELFDGAGWDFKI